MLWMRLFTMLWGGSIGDSEPDFDQQLHEDQMDEEDDDEEDEEDEHN